MKKILLLLLLLSAIGGLLSAAENAMHDTRMAESLKNCPFDKNGNEKILREIESILGGEKA